MYILDYAYMLKNHVLYKSGKATPKEIRKIALQARASRNLRSRAHSNIYIYVPHAGYLREGW